MKRLQQTRSAVIASPNLYLLAAFRPGFFELFVFELSFLFRLTFTSSDQADALCNGLTLRFKGAPSL